MDTKEYAEKIINNLDDYPFECGYVAEEYLTQCQEVERLKLANENYRLAAHDPDRIRKDALEEAVQICRNNSARDVSVYIVSAHMKDAADIGALKEQQ